MDIVIYMFVLWFVFGDCNGSGVETKKGLNSNRGL